LFLKYAKPYLSPWDILTPLSYAPTAPSTSTDIKVGCTLRHHSPSIVLHERAYRGLPVSCVAKMEVSLRSDGTSSLSTREPGLLSVVDRPIRSPLPNSPSHPFPSRRMVNTHIRISYALHSSTSDAPLRVIAQALIRWPGDSPILRWRSIGYSGTGCYQWLIGLFFRHCQTALQIHSLVVESWKPDPGILRTLLIDLRYIPGSSLGLVPDLPSTGGGGITASVRPHTPTPIEK
jgi:hypothetical protein